MTETANTLISRVVGNASSDVYSAYAFASERGNQLVGRPELPRSELGWGCRLKDVASLRHINTDVILCRLEALVPQPPRDFTDVPCCLHNVERASVTKHVRRDALVAQ